MIGSKSTICSLACAGMLTYGMLCSGMSARVKFRNRFDHISELILRQVLMRWERDHAVGMAVGHREIALLVTELPQALLTIDRDRVMHLHLDAGLLAILHQFIATFREHDVEVEYEAAVGEALR